MRLIFLVPNNAWVFVMGDTIVPFDGEPRFFDGHREGRKAAVKAAERKGMTVDKHGNVTVKTTART